MLYKITKAMVCSLDDDTDFFDIVDEVLQRDTFLELVNSAVNNCSNANGIFQRWTVTGPLWV